MHTTMHCQGSIEIARFSYGLIPSVDVDKRHDGTQANPNSTCETISAILAHYRPYAKL